MAAPGDPCPVQGFVNECDCTDRLMVNIAYIDITSSVKVHVNYAHFATC